MRRMLLDSETFRALVLTREHKGAVLAVCPRSEMFMKGEAEDLLALLDVPAMPGQKGVVLDLRACHYISSDGLGAVVKLSNWSRASEGMTIAVVVAAGSSDEVHNLLRITGIDRSLGSALHTDFSKACAYIIQFS